MKFVISFFIIHIIPIIVFSQEYHSEDLELVADSSQLPSVIDSSKQLNISNSTKSLKGMPYLEVSLGNIWLKSIKPIEYFKYSLRLEGFGIAGGLFYQPFPVLGIAFGLRVHQSGNKFVGPIYNYYEIKFDSITNSVHIDSTLMTSEGFFKQNLFYLSMPINANLFVKGLPLYFLGGIEFGYLFQASQYSKATVNNEHFTDIQWNLQKFYRPFDFNLNIGLGTKIDLGNRFNIDIQCVYSHGVILITKDDWPYQDMSREVSLRCLLAFK